MFRLFPRQQDTSHHSYLSNESFLNSNWINPFGVSLPGIKTVLLTSLLLMPRVRLTSATGADIPPLGSIQERNPPPEFYFSYETSGKHPDNTSVLMQYKLVNYAGHYAADETFLNSMRQCGGLTLYNNSDLFAALDKKTLFHAGFGAGAIAGYRCKLSFGFDDGYHYNSFLDPEIDCSYTHEGKVYHACFLLLCSEDAMSAYCGGDFRGEKHYGTVEDLGITVGIVAGAIMTAFGCYFCCKSGAANKQQSPELGVKQLEVLKKNDTLADRLLSANKASFYAYLPVLPPEEVNRLTTTSSI